MKVIRNTISFLFEIYKAMYAITGAIWKGINIMFSQNCKSYGIFTTFCKLLVFLMQLYPNTNSGS